jgi:hypothetical protein
LALAAVLFLAAHTVAARWLLSGPRLRALINTNPENTWIDWDEAVSAWPGRVAVKNLRIRGSDQNVQWIITISEARVRYSVAALLTRTFRVGEVRISSLAFRLRRKVSPEEAGSPRVKQLPPVPGFTDPPLRSREKPEGTSGEENPWSVDVRGISSESLEELWVDGWRYRGRAVLSGRFFLTPGRRARVGPATIDFGGGELRLGEQPVLRNTSGRIAATFDDWDPRRVKGDAVWRVVTGKVSLEGPTDGVDFLEAALSLPPRVRLSGGAGRLAVSGSIERGRARGETALTAKGARYVRPGLTLDGDADARLRIASWELSGGAPEIGGSRLKLSDVFAAGADRSRGWWGEFEIPSGRLRGGFAGRVAGKCRDGRPLLAVLGVKLPGWTRGLVELEDLGFSADVAVSPAGASVRRLAAKGGKFEIRGEYERRGEKAQGVFLIETGPLNVGVRLANGKPGLRLFGAKGWFEREWDLDAAGRR